MLIKCVTHSRACFSENSVECLQSIILPSCLFSLILQNAIRQGIFGNSGDMYWGKCSSQQHCNNSLISYLLHLFAFRKVKFIAKLKDCTCKHPSLDSKNSSKIISSFVFLLFVSETNTMIARWARSCVSWSNIENWTY